MTAIALGIVLAACTAGIDAPEQAAFDFTVAAAPAAESDDALVQTHRVLTGITLGTLLATGGLGTVVAVNRPTLFGDGLCSTDSPLLGDYGCGPLSTIHGGVAMLSLLSYTSTRVLGWVLERTDRWAPSNAQRILGWVHLVGLAILPVAGLTARFPELIGINDPEAALRYQRLSRTLHLAGGYAVIGAYAATTVLRLYY